VRAGFLRRALETDKGDQVVEDWIFVDNLEPFCRIVSGYCGYAFDDSDWDAISFGIQGTDVEVRAWFDYPLVGSTTTQLSIARDPETSVIFVKITSDPGIEAQARTLVDIVNEYRLTQA
jgi:hypothetical protein